MPLHRAELLLADGLVVVRKLRIVAVVAVELELEEANELRELGHAQSHEEHVGADREEPAVLTDDPVGRGHERGENGEHDENHGESGLARELLAQLEVEPGGRGQNAEHEGTAQDESQRQNEDAHWISFLCVGVRGSKARCPSRRASLCRSADE